MKVCEIFCSLQGEGVTIGARTVFVRTSGCNLRCAWCDTLYALEEGREMGLDEIIGEVEKFRCGRVCITGGEPLLQKDLTKLIQRLLDLRYSISVETGGSLSIELLPCDERMSVSMDVKCPSSGMHEKMNLSNLELLSPNDQLKFVIADERDYEHAKEIMAMHKPIAQVVMQPVGGKDLKWLAERALKDKLEVRVLPQLHKLIWGDRRGV